ncbi:MAG TPA: leucyl aminopeptidase [Solirubrobacteraceae bacterium]|jgi:leucyl aminopeptidase
MDVIASSEPLGTKDADTFAVALLDGEGLPAGAPDSLSQLLDSGEARSAYKSLALGHADGHRWLLVGLGARKELTAERARVAAALAAKRCRELSTRTLCWGVPADSDERIAGALVEGTVLADYRFERFKSAPEDPAEPPKQLERLIVAAPEAAAAAIGDAAVVSARANRARDLQNRPSNDLTPTALAEYARELGELIPELSVEVEGLASLQARGMGAFAAVAKGSDEEPALITLRYDGGGGEAAASAPVLGLVGKAVTFDSGGISLKPGAKMAEMKFDMSGGAAVLEASAAIASLGVPIRLVAVIGATENLPSGHAVKPGDIVTAANGKTIEINNTDAEGRLVLADCLCHAAAQGAERIVDLATLTGAVIVALGSTYAAVMSNDDELSSELAAAGQASGETLWRLPLHEEYDALIKGRYADLDNAPEGRKAGTIVGGSFLEKFVTVPWAHIDIAGSAWDLDRAYVGKGASGYGVRLLVELARSLSSGRA